VSSRLLVVGILVLMAAAVMIGWLMIDHRPVVVSPSPSPTPLSDTPAPEPSPWIEDHDLPPVPHLTPVCHCVPAYGACVDQLMVREAARLHAIGHEHDLIGRRCADATEEEQALRRVLRRPERVEANTAATLAMSDRAAYRERVH
jgi:hypothetical protein